MLLRLTFVDTHVRTCETEAPDDLDVFDLNTLTEFVNGELEAAGERWGVVVDTNWVDAQIVDVKVKNPNERWVGPEKLRPRVGARMSAPTPVRVPAPAAPAPEPTLF